MTALATPTDAAASLSMRGATLTLLLVSSLTVMSGATIASSLPALQAHFSETPNVELLTRLVLTVPAAAIVVSAPLAGILADRIGRRPLLVCAILLFALAGASGLVLDSLPALLIGRAALGLAVGAIMTVAAALAGDYFAGAQRQAFIGRQGAFTGAGGLLFIMGGGLLAGLHWRAPFAIYALALLLIPLVLSQLKIAKTVPSGAATTIPNDEPERVSRRLLLLVLGGALLKSISFYLIPTQLPFLLASRGQDTPFLAGLAIGVATLTSAAMSLNYRRISQLVSTRAVFAGGFALMSIAYAIVASSPIFLLTLLAMAIAGAGLGMIMPAFSFAALEIAPPAARGAVMGGLTSAIFLGQFLSPFVSQPYASAFGLPAAFGMMGLLLCSLAFAIVASGFVVPRLRATRTSE